jgi:hypothetical protein
MASEDVSSIIESSVVTLPWHAARRTDSESAAKSFLDIQKRRKETKEV